MQSVIQAKIRLAGLPKEVLQTAQLRADKLKYETNQRRLLAITQRSHKALIAASTQSASSPASVTLKNANALHRALQLFVK